MAWYCLFCKGGQEQSVMQMLRQRGALPLSPLVVRPRPGQKGLERAQARLLPGYVFFEQEGPVDWPGLLRFSAVLRVLHYQDEDPVLRGADLAFVEWLQRYEGLIDVSEVMKVGTKIAFVSGPLVGMEAKVLQVNKSRKAVQIAVGDQDSLLQAVWCSIEYVQEHVDLEQMTHSEGKE